MSKKLIIAEKPSVANDIARALGGFTRHGDYYESDEYVLSSAIGHLLELAAPEQFEVKRGKWSFANLPVIPPHFDLPPDREVRGPPEAAHQAAQAQGRHRRGQRLRRGARGRADLPLHRAAHRREEADRAAVAAVDDASPRSATASQACCRTTRCTPLADAAVSRSESDWLVGINGTRAMTAFNSKDGGFYKTTVGRVQTPTLAILVEREKRIKAFVSRDYWEVIGTFVGAGGEYTGRWFDEQFERKPPTSMRAPSASGTRRAPRRCATCASASPASSPRRPSPPRRARRCCTTSPACSARRTRASASRRATRWASRRRCTRSTRCSPIRGPTRARCPRTTCRR